MTEDEGRTLRDLAFAEAAGPAVVLDGSLRVVHATEEASSLVGGRIQAGDRIVHVLCGESENRPVAEALSRGEPASASVVRPAPPGERVIAVRTTPLRRGDDVVGHVLFLSSRGEVGSGVVDEHGILTRSQAMHQLLRDLRKVARSHANVLVRGETGAGKELIARALHEESRRSQGPFRALNCAALPPHLLESELFGHVRGAFTGAVRDVEGHIQSARGGTLFLDEVAELPLELQAKLLRVLQERTVLPVGGREPIPVDVRVVSATHRSLREAVAAGRFRADLMYRLRVVPMFLPPLRDRPTDIPLLAERFVAVNNERSAERQVERIAPGARAALTRYDWPGNVRELQNAIEYAFILGEGPVLSEAELPPEVRGEEGRRPTPVNAPEEAGAIGHEASRLPSEARRLVRALERFGGNREQAAASLGMSRTTLWRKLKQYGLDTPRGD